MRILPFFFGLSDKLAPMNPTDKMELNTDLNNEYTSLLGDVNTLKSIKAKQKLNVALTESEASFKPSTKIKILYFLESPYARLLLAIAFPIFLKKLTDWLYAPKEPDYIDDEEE